ncbi:ribosome recycling factor [Patescibacteria group bacterium]|jgi:ribosome recycling factor|nr:ribosome recycling factor [Patescibacteria group bacterium]
MNRIDEHKGEFQAVIDHFHKELSGLRTGRASAALVENIRVEAYGQTMDLKSMANISTPDAKTVQIEPWDKGVVKDIEKALVDASLGMQPNVAGSTIRLAMPPMTEENRKNMAKVLHQKEEQAKIGMRNVREKIKTAIQNDEKEKVIAEDEKRRQLEQLDKVVAEWNGKVETITTEKEKEIMTV